MPLDDHSDFPAALRPVLILKRQNRTWVSIWSIPVRDTSVLKRCSLLAFLRAEFELDSEVPIKPISGTSGQTAAGPFSIFTLVRFKRVKACLLPCMIGCELWKKREEYGTRGLRIAAHLVWLERFCGRSFLGRKEAIGFT